MRKRTQRDLVDRVKREMGIDDSLIADSVRGQKTVPELRTSFMYFNGPFRYRYFMYRKGRSLRKFCWSTTRNDGGVLLVVGSNGAHRQIGDAALLHCRKKG